MQRTALRNSQRNEGLTKLDQCESAFLNVSVELESST